eukprot:614662-Amphidinium_carterae.1
MKSICVLSIIELMAKDKAHTDAPQLTHQFPTKVNNNQTITLESKITQKRFMQCSCYAILLPVATSPDFQTITKSLPRTGNVCGSRTDTTIQAQTWKRFLMRNQ